MHRFNSPAQAANLCLTLAVACALAPLAHAQSPAGWPARPITIVVPTTPSSASDVWSRMYSKAVGEATGWRFLIDNKPGAGATLGTAFVAKTAPDAHTLLTVSSTFTTAPVTYRNLGWDPIRSFAPISLFSNGSSMLMVHPALPVKSYAEYVAYARANPGRISFGNSGVGSTYHLSGIALHKAMGAEVTYIPYKGSGDVTNAILAGEIQAMFGAISVNLPVVKGGKARALGVTTRRRATAAPDLPTLAELCNCDFEHNAWTGVVAPAGSPPAALSTLSREFIKAGSTPDIAKRLAGAGMEAGGSTPEVLGHIIASETEKWQRVVRENNLVIQPE